jgi:hypothetical protein
MVFLALTHSPTIVPSPELSRQLTFVRSSTTRLFSAMRGRIVFCKSGDVLDTILPEQRITTALGFFSVFSFNSWAVAASSVYLYG